MNNYYKPGSWNVICEVCGRKFKSDEVRKRWDGLIVCKSDFEERHILDFIRVRPEHTAVPYTVPEPTDQFVAPSLCPYPTTGGMADIGTADCALAGIPIIVGDTATLPIADIAIASTFKAGSLSPL
jgi:hypothetical protein